MSFSLGYWPRSGHAFATTPGFLARSPGSPHPCPLPPCSCLPAMWLLASLTLLPGLPAFLAPNSEEKALLSPFFPSPRIRRHQQLCCPVIFLEDVNKIVPKFLLSLFLNSFTNKTKNSKRELQLTAAIPGFSYNSTFYQTSTFMRFCNGEHPNRGLMHTRQVLSVSHISSP